MSFRNSICDHLAQYKQSDLGIVEDGKFYYRQKDLNKAHILDINTPDLNLLEQYRAQILLSEKDNPIKRHQYFHHLNSSQALCINLFSPLIIENQLVQFLEYIGIAPAGEIASSFEKESEIEIADRKTSFDLFVKNGTGSNIFVETKYTEDGFSTAKYDKEHIDKFHDTYLPLLNQSTFQNSICNDTSFFLDH